MAIAGNVILTINGQRVEGIREVTFTETRPDPPGRWLRFADAEDRRGGKTDMRTAVALHIQKEAALERWRNFNSVYGLPYPWHWRKKPPKPTPKQYRLKHRAAGAKRRNKRVR